MSAGRRGIGPWYYLFRVLALLVVAAEFTARSLADQEASQRNGLKKATSGQGPSVPGTWDLAAAPGDGFEFAQAVTHEAPLSATGSAEVLKAASSSQKMYRTEKAVPSDRSGERYYASATDHYSGGGGGNGGPGFGFPDSMRHFQYGSGPKGYNTQRAYAYEKVYPERTYSTNHATSYERHYNDDDNQGRPRGHGYETRYSSSYPVKPSGYGYRHSDSYGSDKGGRGGGGGGSYGPSHYGPKGSGYESRRYDYRPTASATSSGRRGGGGGAGPKIRRYVYKNPHDQSTTRVVEMQSGSGSPPWAESSVSQHIWKPGGMEDFVAGLIRNG
ncbi:hypothetical protein V5799_008820 [Amblyomma americanum]|uniref:Secreted protein n=1 Tax=Amblyomma americanum TaxID=6943 RepID=A0AAQ4FCC4_AMBAM